LTPAFVDYASCAYKVHAPPFRESISWIISPFKFWTATIFLHAHLQVVYYKCVKFHKNPISGLGGVALTRYMDRRTGWFLYTPQTVFAGGIKKNFKITLDLLFSTFLKLVHVQINCIFFDNTLYIYNIYVTEYETQEKVCQCYLVLSIWKCTGSLQSNTLFLLLVRLELTSSSL
jgi:hypothetical protein